jgi:membrane-associated phospholipid phosphatase
MTTKTESLPERGQRNLYLAALIAAAIVFSLGAYLTSKGRPLGWEATWFTAINGWSDGWYRFFVIATFFGSSWAAVLAVIGAFAARAYRLAWRLALTIVGAYGIAYLAKHLIGRARPAEIVASVHVRVAETGMGFPSGHATISTVIAFTVWPYLPKRVRWVLVPLFVAMVCLSRLYLGVHFPLDIVGGVAIGVGAVSFVRVLPVAFRRLIRVS